MNTKDYKIHIVGAGVSGLIAAQVLEEYGYCPIVLEASERIGGRLKTDLIEGYQLDHGFQVLLTAYPAAKKYLNFKALDLQEFVPGASIFNNGNQKVIGDPMRDFSLLFSTLFSGIGTITDKLKILKLNRRLKSKTIAEIFLEKEQSTYHYLLSLGFSHEIINTFFKPFFSGIFLENKLDTSSRMFEFVYKMFGEGYAALPKAGIEAIPKQLFNNLKQTNFKFNTKVESIEEDQIVLSNSERLSTHFTIIATEASNIIRIYGDQQLRWKSCDTIYFETQNRNITKPLIGLIPKSGSLINNIFYHTSLDTLNAGKKELLSVTVVENKNLPKKELVELVKKELLDQCNIESARFIKYYRISKALPDLSNIQYNKSLNKISLPGNVFLAGDTLLNGSLNAAMISGENAALSIVSSIKNGYFKIDT